MVKTPFAQKIRGFLSSVTRWLGDSRASRPLLLTHAPEATEWEAGGSPPPVAPKAVAPIELERGPAPADRKLLATIFDSAHPVRTRAELFGRDKELGQLLSASLDFHQHSVVHGARGSGKTSLVRVFGDYADQNNVIVIYMACEPNARFAELLRPYLRSIPPAALAPGEKERFRQSVAALPDNFTPRAFVELIAESVTAPLVLIFDEFDRITDPAIRSDIAAAMKMLSDSLSSVLFMLVGIARNVSDVIDGHPSLRRHMRTVALGRIEEDSVDALIDRGATAAGLTFEAAARALIARAACGSPFHVRMFCHHAGLAALRRGSPAVEAADVRAGLATAIDVWGGMNEEDATTFRSLVRVPERRADLERIARDAALSDHVATPADGPANNTIRMLGDVLGADTTHRSALVFRDSVAPQFLIAQIILTEDAPAYGAPRAVGLEA